MHHTDAIFVDIIHTSENFGLDELSNPSAHMHFHADTGASNVNACDDIKDRMNSKETVILYEEAKLNKNQRYNDIDLTDQAKWTTWEKTKKWTSGLFSTLLNGLSSAPKRVFISLHQFFGCSHLVNAIFLFSCKKK